MLPNDGMDGLLPKLLVVGAAAAVDPKENDVEGASAVTGAGLGAPNENDCAPVYADGVLDIFPNGVAFAETGAAAVTVGTAKENAPGADVRFWGVDSAVVDPVVKDIVGFDASEVLRDPPNEKDCVAAGAAAVLVSAGDGVPKENVGAALTAGAPGVEAAFVVVAFAPNENDAAEGFGASAKGVTTGGNEKSGCFGTSEGDATTGVWLVLCPPNEKGFASGTLPASGAGVPKLKEGIISLAGVEGRLTDATIEGCGAAIKTGTLLDSSDAGGEDFGLSGTLNEKSGGTSTFPFSSGFDGVGNPNIGLSFTSDGGAAVTTGAGTAKENSGFAKSFLVDSAVVATLVGCESLFVALLSNSTARMSKSWSSNPSS